MELSLAEVQQATGARWADTLGGVEREALRARIVTGWSIDSRSVSAGDLFFAITGDRFDGHSFLKAAFQAGALAGLVSRPTADAGGPLLSVDDTVRSLAALARYAREKWNRPLVAVTGSAGKTSTKDIIAAFLGVRFRVDKTVGNLNNHIGLPLTLLRFAEDAEVGVVEMGMNHQGEIRELAAIALPQIGVVTNVGFAHIEAFESIEGIAAAKRELIEALPGNGTAILNLDDSRVAAFRGVHGGRVVTYGFNADADVQARNLVLEADGTTFTVNGIPFQTRLAGRHAISNILAGLAVAQVFAISPEELVEQVASLVPGKMRGTKRQLGGITILDDSYNSNPEAARSMLDVLLREPGKRRIAVLGEMLELGKWAGKLHRDLGRYAAEKGVDILIGVAGAGQFMVDEARMAGMPPEAALCFDDAETAGEHLRSLVRPGDVVLFKGSRGTHIERALVRMEP